MEVIVPPENSHWSLRFVDVWKPFPERIVANATYKVLRFFYPPFAMEAVDVTHVVSDPELDCLNVGLYLVFPFLLACLCFNAYRVVKKPRKVVKQPPVRLTELEQRMYAKYGSEYKLGIWRRKDISDPLLKKSISDIQKMLPEAFEGNHCLRESAEDIVKGNVTFNEEVKCRLFEKSSQLNIVADKLVDMVGQINTTVKERSGEDKTPDLGKSKPPSFPVNRA
ncbi:uncharacterized protein LOC108088766 [Drosophila ficusphila]|uniref:uncharacterized protein LOC108088766 n=1 Tax=Drosophila ficusphila TaxID=30025 RepID=UPI0007E75DE0|nr:uncharacterized protein LOC108088766 [Drosophila ficusphila]